MTNVESRSLLGRKIELTECTEAVSEWFNGSCNASFDVSNELVTTGLYWRHVEAEAGENHRENQTIFSGSHKEIAFMAEEGTECWRWRLKETGGGSFSVFKERRESPEVLKSHDITRIAYVFA